MEAGNLKQPRSLSGSRRTHSIPCEKCSRTFVTVDPRQKFCDRGCYLASKRGTEAHRFWSKVEKIPFVECWYWVASFTTDNGYGRFRVGGRDGYTENAHRYSWVLEHGDEPKLWVLHKCDNRLCVRPDHLFLGTHEDNMADMARKGRGRKPMNLEVVR